MCWLSGLNFPGKRFFGLREASWRADSSVFGKYLRRGPTVQSTWPRVGDGAVSTPLFADKKVGLGALSSDPWIQQL